MPARDDEREAKARALERVKELDLAHRNRLRPASRLTLSMRYLASVAAGLSRPATPTRVARVPHPEPGSIAVTLVGHATVMLTTPRTRVLIDPLLSERLFVLRRARLAGISDDDLRDVSLVLLSHAGLDRLHRPSLRRLPRSATVLLPPRCADLVSDLDFARVLELSTGNDFGMLDVQVVAVPARHGSVRGLGERARRHASGYIIRCGGITIYSAGGTGYFSGFGAIGRRHHPDVALLPVGGYEPASLRASHMSPLDAVYAFEDVGARLMIPVRYGDFPLSYEPLGAPLQWLRQLRDERGLEDRMALLAPGETCHVRRPATQADIPIEVDAPG